MCDGLQLVNGCLFCCLVFLQLMGKKSVANMHELLISHFHFSGDSFSFTATAHYTAYLTLLVLTMLKVVTSY